MESEMDRGSKILLWAFGLSFVVVLLATAYIFLYKKDYDFYVEAACNPSFETCQHRDCSEPDSCPPNNLEIYKTYKVKAGDFAKCTDNSCANECTNGTIACQAVACDASAGDECVGIPAI